MEKQISIFRSHGMWLWIVLVWWWTDHAAVSLGQATSSIPETPLQIVEQALVSNKFSIKIDGQSDTLYWLERSTDLAAWEPLVARVTGADRAAEFSVPSWYVSDPDRIFLRIARSDMQPAHARALWQANGSGDYRFRLEYGSGRSYAEAVVTVEDGSVVSVEEVGGSGAGAAAKPLPDYIDLIEEGQDILVGFHPLFGYPRNLVDDPMAAAVDGAIEYQLELLEARFEDPVNGWASIIDALFQREYRVQDGRLTVRFEAVEEDSRCPIGVFCVWEGQAIIAVRLEETGAPPATVRLGIFGGRSARIDADSVVKTYRGYAIQLLHLEPYPRIDNLLISEEFYEATLRIWKP